MGRENVPLSKVEEVEFPNDAAVVLNRLYFRLRDGDVVDTAIDVLSARIRVVLGDVTVYPSSSRQDFKISSFSRVEFWVNLQSSASSVMVFDSLDEGKIFTVAASNSCSILPTRDRCDARKSSAFRCFSSVKISKDVRRRRRRRCEEPNVVTTAANQQQNKDARPNEKN